MVSRVPMAQAPTEDSRIRIPVQPLPKLLSSPPEWRRHTLVVLLGLALAFAAVPASALATDRFASPADIGTGDCLSEVNSCDLPTAVSGAGANDDIFVRGDLGDYSLSAQLTNAAAVHYHGT